ncbi:hypothetical protein G7Z17_g10641 [Cylindrodendrum hubeiense]|uniref:Glycoside hydrolase family 16 protein n=1 Tax=Cylindrodendrum hubeiense TaxID=595255 RepID=A0A9P5GZ49_9HYPO|nr:hypothetical protein G7Z17_g10641 [Cylindrodendrum hubeiense]
MAYQLVNSYAGDALISGFNFISYEDPSAGFVAIKKMPSTKGSIRLIPTQILRLESKESFERGLFIADFLHMPPSQCGVWPAFWAFGADWPNGGELDIVEGANLAYTNIMSAHTADGCSLSPSDTDRFTGERRNLDCAIGDDNVGCGYNPPASDTSSYGDGFNAVGGGVYAVQWNNEYLSVWHFPRDSIPDDIESQTPDPSGWGLPQAVFGGADCAVADFFNNMNLVININFCGDYGGSTWSSFDTCTEKAATCEDYVANNPAAFENAYWDVKYINVYQFPNDGGIDIGGGGIDIGGGGEDPTASMPSNATASVTTPGTEPATTEFITIATIEEPSGSPSTSGTTEFITIATVSEPSSTPSVSNPGQIGNYSFLGCFGSSSSFSTFDLTEDDDQMTLELCVDTCDGITYAGVFEGKCYCADSLDAGTRALADVADCDHPCPGDEDEFCGGLANARRNSTDRRWIQHRDAPSNYLLTVYGDVGSDEPDSPPPMRPPASVSASASARPAGLTTTITYTIPCPTNLASLMPQTYVATVEDCSCTSQPSVPMETKMVECEGCGPEGESTITVTVPVTTTATAVKHVVATALSPPALNLPLNIPLAKVGNLSTPLETPVSTPDEDVPLVVASGSGWNEVKTSITLTAVAAVLFAIMLSALHFARVSVHLGCIYHYAALVAAGSGHEPLPKDTVDTMVDERDEVGPRLIGNEVPDEAVAGSGEHPLISLLEVIEECGFLTICPVDVAEYVEPGFDAPDLTQEVTAAEAEITVV